MAKKFLTNLDLQKNQLLQAVIQNLAVAPEGAKLGQVYFDTLKSQFGVCVAIDEAGVRTWAYMSSAAELAVAIADLEGKINAKVAQADYDAKVEELEGAIAAKVAQADYDAKMALLDAEDQKAAAHIADGDIHVTAEQKAAWTAKQDALSEAQLAAANSGITADKVSTYDAYAGQIATKVETETFNAKVEELEGAIATKVETETFNAKVEEINGAIALKADQETTYTKDEVDEIVEGINSAIESSLPAQEGQAGKVLVTDGADASWGYTTFIKEGKDGEKAGVSELVINKLSQKEYDELEAAGLINENELYITSDENKYYNTDEIDGKIDALNEAIDAKVAQADYDAKVEELEAKDAELAGKIEALEAKDEELVAEDERLAGLIGENTAAIATKVETETFNAKVEEINGAIALKANAADVYTKGEVYTKDEADALLATKVNAESYATDKQALEGAIALKANAADVYTKEEVNGLVSSVYKFKGSVETFEDLPSEGLVEGDVYNVKATGENYAWVAATETEEGHWDDLGGDIDLSGYYTKTEVDGAFATKEELSAVSGGAVHKVVATNPELVPAEGVASWTVEHNLGDDVNVAVKEIATGEEVVVDVLQMSNQVKIKMNADETIAAETYKVVING